MAIKSIFFTVLMAVLIFSGCHEAKSFPLSPEMLDTEQDVPQTDVPEQAETPDYVVSSLEEFNALKLKAGDLVVWKNGTYANLAVKVKGKGTEAEPIVIKAENPGKVIFTGASSMSLSGSYIRAEGFFWDDIDTSVKTSIMTAAKGSENCTFTDCLIDGTGSKASTVDSKWVSLYGRHNEISNCTFIDKRNMGCLLVVWMEADIVPEHVIRNNYFTRPYTHYSDSGSAKNGQETIRIGTSDYSMSDACCLVEGNHFYRCHGERAEIISSKSCGNVYTGNLFEESDGTLTLRHGNRCLVKGNYFTSGKKADVGGVRIIGEDHVVEENVFLELTGSGYKSALCMVRGESDAALNGYWTVKNAMVRNNVFVNCRYGIVVNYSGRATQDAAPVNSTFEKNIIWSKNKSSYTPVYVIDTDATQMHWLGNVIYGGKCNGIELHMTETAPEIADYTENMNVIRKNAGKTW